MSRNDVASPNGLTGQETNPSLANPESSRVERFAEQVLRGPLVWFLGLVAFLQLATWIPHYLTWPYWADHDVHATLARAWDRGLLPYRDMRCNNFPGSIYLFWILGKVAGWGKTLPFYAFDAGLVVALGVALATWSQRKLGGLLPGLVGYLTYLSYYLALDYPVTGQKDWHGPFLAVLGLLIAELWPGRAGRTFSALALALAVVFRPQAVLFLPAALFAIDESTRAAGEPISKTVRAGLEWGITFALLLLIGFMPLLLAGVVPDFLESLRFVSYGGRYNTVTLWSLFPNWFAQIAPMRVMIIPLAFLLLGRMSGLASRRTALTWFVALAGGSLYKPISPYPHVYLAIPMMLIWSVNVTVLTHLVMAARPMLPSIRLVAVLMILAVGVTVRPLFCVVTKSLEAVAMIKSGGIPEAIPSGYRGGTVPTAAYYPWSDYRALLMYLRDKTTPDTKVANVLRWDPAVLAAVDRPSAFPAEAITWLRMVNPDDEHRFAESLRDSGANSVVVWIPGEVGPHPPLPLDEIQGIIREQYQPETRFGNIEVWRRKGAPKIETTVRSQQSGPSQGPG